MIKIFLKALLFTYLFLLFFSFSNSAPAQAITYNCKCNGEDKAPQESCVDCYIQCCLTSDPCSAAECSPVLSIPTQATTNPPGTVKLENPIAAESPQALIGIIINYILGIVGSLALVMFVFGGITWMTSAGSAEKIKKGRDILIWAAIGLVIIFSSYALVNFVIKGIV